MCTGDDRMQREAVRWNVRVSKSTDRALRSFLGPRGRKRGELSKFVEQAVRAQVFHRSVLAIKAPPRSLPPVNSTRSSMISSYFAIIPFGATLLRSLPRLHSLRRRPLDLRRYLRLPRGLRS